jgi:hypothetical protein
MINIYNQKWVHKFVPYPDTYYEAVMWWPFIIYTHPKEEIPDRLRRHEEFHWNHALRWGVIPWYIAYWFLHAQYGYKDNPFEIMAREAENDT